MTNKQLFEMLTKWVQDLNPKAYLKRADARCGAIYAIATKNEDTSVHCWTSYMTLKELEKVLVVIYDINNFLKIKEA